nr:hypothetical protein [Methylococcus mesophilus]
MYRWIACKGLAARRVGRLWKFQVSEVDNCARVAPKMSRRERIHKNRE